MGIIRLHNLTPSGEKLEALFDPDRGMNLVSFKRGSHEVIDQSTKPLFDERCAGLGALIGPHFHNRKEPAEVDPELFPHVKVLQAQGRKEPFPHGVARYARWSYESSHTQVCATLSGEDALNGVKLKEIEGGDFTISFWAALLSDGLLIHYRIQSAFPSVIGFHTYYRMEKGSEVCSKVMPSWRVKGEWKEIPSRWMTPSGFHFPADKPVDSGLIPSTDSDSSFHRIVLKTSGHVLHVDYASRYEGAWQLWHPEGDSFICIEPLSAIDPENPVYFDSFIDLKLSVFNI